MAVLPLLYIAENFPTYRNIASGELHGKARPAPYALLETYFRLVGEACKDAGIPEKNLRVGKADFTVSVLQPVTISRKTLLVERAYKTSGKSFAKIRKDLLDGSFVGPRDKAAFHFNYEGNQFEHIQMLRNPLEGLRDSHYPGIEREIKEKADLTKEAVKWTSINTDLHLQPAGGFWRRPLTVTWEQFLHFHSKQL